MRENGFIIALIVNFIMFLSLFPVVSNLTGKAAIVELILMIILILMAIKMLFSIAKVKPGVWKAMFLFYAINLINELVLYFRSYLLKPLILPFMVTFLGFLIALIKMKSSDEEDFDFEEPEAEEEKPVEEKAEKKATKTTRKTVAKKTTKKTTKKTARKKPTKRKAAKKKAAERKPAKKKTTRKKKK